MILCLAVNPSIDKLFEVERLRPGKIHRPVRFIQVAGGKGVNTARVANALGAEVEVVLLLGGHAGRWMWEALRAEHIPCRAVWGAAETRSSLSVADRDTGSLTEFYEAGDPITEEDYERLLTLTVGLLHGARWLTMSGSLPRDAPPDAYAVLVDEARAAGVGTILDSRADALRRGVAKGPTAVKINAAEATELTGIAAHDAAGARDAASAAWRMAGGPGHAVVVTLGVDGAVLVDAEGGTWRASLDATGPYPVGSGDAFLAGLVTATTRHGATCPGPADLALAVASASANAERAGAGRFDPQRAADLVPAVTVQPIG